MAKIYAFDAYGTLLDVHSAVRRVIGDSPDAQQLSAIWRTKQLEYTWVHTLMGQYQDFWALTVAGLAFARAQVPILTDAQHQQLLDAYMILDCFGEVPEVLHRLQQAGHRLAVLSNGTDEMLTAALSHAGIDMLFDDVLSVNSLQQFKTQPAVYQLVLDRFGCAPGDVQFQSSNRWDIAGAHSFGFATNWINRSGQPDEYLAFPADRALRDLRGL